MSLTVTELKSIKDIVDTSMFAFETRLIKRIDELDDKLSTQMEKGFQEIIDICNQINKYK